MIASAGPLGVRTLARRHGGLLTGAVRWLTGTGGVGLRSDPAVRRAIEEQIPIRRIATVDDLAMWYVFLASDAASYATGTIVTVDGGLDAQQMGMRPIAASERHP